MSLSRQEIIEYASPYVNSGEAVDFPDNSDLFCLVGRDLPEGKVLTDEEGWGFQGYGVCLGYTLDQESKPLGKWLWMHFASLASFPPTQQVFKLQPPHVVKGKFQNPGRTSEFRIIKVNVQGSPKADNTTQAPFRSQKSKSRSKQSDSPKEDIKGKIVKFRAKNKA